MITKDQPIDEIPLNRTKLSDSEGWNMVKLGDIAYEVSDRVENPSESELGRFVGLEHLESGSFIIRQWGSTADVTSAMKLFQSGDTLFARRNAYLKRASMATFDGVCSGDAIVLREKQEMIVKGFLPFILNTDELWNYAIANAAGSMSKRVKWHNLAEYEFILPSKDEQRRIADILWAADETYMSWQIVFNNLNKIRDTDLDTLFASAKSQATSHDGWMLKRLDKLAVVQTGLAKGKDYGNEPIVSRPYLRVANVQDGYLDLSEIKEITVAVKDIERYLLKVGDVLLTEGGDFDKLGRGTVWRAEVDGCLHQNHVFCVRPDTNKLLPEFLSLQTSCGYGKQYFLSCSKQTTNLASINAAQVKAFPVLLTSIEEQKRIMDYFVAIETHLREVNKHIMQINQLKRRLLMSLLDSK